MKTLFFILITVLSSCAHKRGIPESTLVDQFSENRSQISPIPSNSFYDPMIFPTLKLNRQSQGARNEFEIDIEPFHLKKYKGLTTTDRRLCFDPKERSKSTPTRSNWLAKVLTIQCHLRFGYFRHALFLSEELVQIEKNLLGRSEFALVYVAQAEMAIGKSKRARQIYLQVIHSLKKFKLPSTYLLSPSNKWELMTLALAQWQALKGLSLIEFKKKKYDLSKAWIVTALKSAKRILNIGQHPLYKYYFTLPQDFYSDVGSALNFYAALLSIDSESEAFVVQNYANQFLRTKKNSPPLFASLIKAHLLQEKKKLAKAKNLLESYLTQSSKKGDTRFTWIAKYKLATLSKEREKSIYLQNLKAAFHSYYSRVRSYPLSAPYLSLLNIDEEIISELIQQLLKAKKYDELFSVLEKSKILEFEKIVRESLDQVASNNQSMSLSFDALRELELYYERKNYSPSREQALKENFANEIEDLELTAPEYASFFGRTTLSMKDTKLNLPAKTQLLLSIPGKTKDKLQLLLIDSQLTQLISLNSSSEEFLKMRKAFLSEIEKDRPDQQSILLERFRKIFPQTTFSKNTFFISSKSLHSIPWPGLDLPKQVTNIPNARWLALMDIVGQQKKIQFWANDEQESYSLKNSLDEVVKLSSIFQNAPFLNKHANKENYLNQIRKNETLLTHLAIPCKQNSRFPLQSSLIFSKDNRAVHLTSRQLLNWKKNIQIVSFSSCLLNPIFKQALYFSGVKQVISSLWPVSPKNRAKFFRTFFEHFKESGDLHLSLKNSSAKLKKEGEPASTYAAFFIDGGF